MSLHPGERVELSIEKPAAGGRMIARHDRQVVLVQGAIPGERVVARIQRVERQLAFADTVQVIDVSPDRQASDIDGLCGGCVYAHVRYPRQLELKRQVIEDAFARLGRIPLGAPVIVTASPDRAYRMRARLHVRGSRIGFYREASHDLCDAATTGQLSDATVSSARRAVESLAGSGCSVSTVELAENISADERVVHAEMTSGGLTDAVLDEALSAGDLTGCTARTAEGALRTSGVPVVTDPLAVLTDGRVGAGALQRHVESFFQANRFMLPRLVTTVLDAVGAEGEVLDLYAGVGLFSVALAAGGTENVTAVEGDRSCAADLQRNAAMNGATVRVAVASVEDFLRRRQGPSARTIVVDPPRSGISTRAMAAVVGHHAARIVYVSCDPPTMARDARRLVDGGYELRSLTGLDLFPNTPHVETVGVFERIV